MIIDFHTHVGKADPWYKSQKLQEEKKEKLVDDLLNEMKRNNVNKSVVITAYKLPHKLKDANLELSQSIKNHKDKLIPFAWLDPRIEDSSETLELLVEKHGFKGLKLHPLLNGYYLSNEVVFPLIEKSIELSIPVLIHTGYGVLGDVNLVSVIAKAYTDARLVIGHMIEPDCINVAKRHENVFLETSDAPHLKVIEKAVKVVGAEKILYGTDYPFCDSIKSEISKIKLADIKDEEKELILSGNATRLLKL